MLEKILALIAVSFGKKATVYAIGRVSRAVDKLSDRGGLGSKNHAKLIL